MKEQAIQYLAFDVHQATAVANQRDESGKVVLQAAVPTEAQAILRLVKGAGPRVHVAFEEGTQAQWLHDLVAPHGEKMIVSNMRGRNASGNKNDRIDVVRSGVDQMSEDLRRGTLKPVFHGTPNVLTSRSWCAVTTTSSRMPRESCRGSKPFRARAIPTKGTAVYRDTERKEWPDKIDGGARVRAAALFKHLDVLRDVGG